MELNSATPEITHATHYAYDIAGNVKSLLQADYQLKALGDFHAFKRIDYDYDRVSGNVNAVHYQDAQIDQYHYRYIYDADNRITHALSSKDGVIWDQDAKYFYYAHGPLAREEVGEDLIQGKDYVYNLQGWIKGVNTPTLRQGEDPGRDGLRPSQTVANLNRNFATDVMGYQLNYYWQQSQKDYQAIGRNQAYYADPHTTVGSDYAAAHHDLFNGNIGSMVTGITLESSTTPGTFVASMQATAYQYDQLNRIVQSVAYDQYDALNRTWSPNQNGIEKYKTTYTYDGMGNLQTLTRKDELGVLFDDLTYTYQKYLNGDLKRNQLSSVEDLTATSALSDDLEGLYSYAYDEIGQLKEDPNAHIDTIKWDVYNKIKTLVLDASNHPLNAREIRFRYDGMGNRVSKEIFYTDVLRHFTYYVRDAAGNVLSVYSREDTLIEYFDGQGQSVEKERREVRQKEVHLYGSARLGLDQTERRMELWEYNGTYPAGAFTSLDKPGTQTGAAKRFGRLLGQKQYELSNHLGNVLAVVSDRKQVELDEPGGPGTPPIITHYTAELILAQDYFPFGMNLPGRKYQTEAYRFAFNGKEQDPGVKGEGVQYDYGFRIYDARIAKFLSVDPLAPSYPWYTPYQFAGNKPIWAIDLDGLEELIFHEAFNSHGGKIILEIFKATSAYRKLKAVTNSQSDYDIYFVPLKFNNQYQQSSQVNWYTWEDSFQGFAEEGVYGQTREISNKIDFQKVMGSISPAPNYYKVSPKVWEEYLKNFEYEMMKEDDINTTFEAGKKLLVIGINYAFIDLLNQAEANYNLTPVAPRNNEFVEIWTISRLQNVALEGAHSLGHEAVAHAINKLKKIELSEAKEHKIFNNVESKVSPSLEEISKEPVYFNSPAHNLFKELKSVVPQKFKL